MTPGLDLAGGGANTAVRGRARLAWRIAREEWRAMARSRVALAAGLMLLVLTVTALLVSREQVRAVNAERAHLQAQAEEQWNSQPDRHPHRVVHYGRYIFRPLTPLAFFDFGVTPYTGHTLYLEGHRQNSANFSDASQSSLLLRFGQLTPAFVLHTVAPLLIVFLAFGSVARAREGGQLRQAVAQGVPGVTLLGGKLLGHAGSTLALAAPALAALGAIALLHADLRAQAAWMLAGYAAYLLLWTCAAVLVSALAPRARTALLALVAAWMVTVVLLPRILPEIASAMVARPTRIEMEAGIARQLRALGDSHNPDDPYFSRFRAGVLAQYGVARVEDLPVNYRALLMAEGERLTSELFERTMRTDFARQQRQADWMWPGAWLSPAMALQRLSAALAGTDRPSHERFLLEGEAYRYRLIQSLNRLHAEHVAYENDRGQRIGAQFWRALPPVAPPAPDAGAMVWRGWRQGPAPALALLAAWLAVMAAVAVAAGRRLERSVA
jgi:ABC-2 type transport system permease protein